MTFQQIEHLRRQAGMTPTAMCRKAGVGTFIYFRARSGKTKPSAATLRRWKQAIEGNGRGIKKPAIAADLIRTAYRGWLVHYCLEAGLDPAAVLASDPARRATANKDWARAAEIRAMAVSSVVTELDLPAKRVAEAIGVTRQAASEMLKRVEDLREDDDGRLTARGALIERAGILISGRAA